MKLIYGYVAGKEEISLRVDPELAKEVQEIFEYKLSGYVGSKMYEEASETLKAIRMIEDLIKEAKEEGQEQDTANDYDIVNDPTLPF